MICHETVFKCAKISNTGQLIPETKLKLMHIETTNQTSIGERS